MTADSKGVRQSHPTTPEGLGEQPLPAHFPILFAHNQAARQPPALGAVVDGVARLGGGVDQAVARLHIALFARPGCVAWLLGVGDAHLAGEMLKSQGKLFMTHIPYRGVAPLTNDLVGNNLEFGVFVLSSGLPHIKSGKVMALGTTEAKRSPITPDIPALAESPQFKNVDIGVWFALMAPANLPKPVHDKLRKALTDALQSPEFRKKLEATGSVVASPTVDTDKYIASEIDKYRKIVQFAKIEE